MTCWMWVLGTELWSTVRGEAATAAGFFIAQSFPPAAYGLFLKATITDITDDQHILPQIWRPEVRSRRTDSTIALCRPFLSSSGFWLLLLTSCVPSVFTWSPHVSAIIGPSLCVSSEDQPCVRVLLSCFCMPVMCPLMGCVTLLAF